MTRSGKASWLRLSSIVMGLWSACQYASVQADPPTPVIFDTDIGTDVDDAWALVMAARSPQIDLLAVTVWRRDVDVRARLARKLLNDCQREDVPVGKGAATSLSGAETFFGGWEGKGYLQSDEVLPGKIEDSAADLIIRTLEQSPRPVTIVSVGGVTNLALAFRKSPQCLKKVARLTLMGGSVHPIVVAGRTLPSKMESNFGADVEAAREVLSSGVPVTLVPAEVTMHALLRTSDYEPLRQADTSLAKGMCAMTDVWARFISGFAKGNQLQEYYADTVVLLHDPLAVYTLMKPADIQSEPVRLRLETIDGELKLLKDEQGPVAIDLVTGADMPRLSRAASDAVLRPKNQDPEKNR